MEYYVVYVWIFFGVEFMLVIFVEFCLFVYMVKVLNYVFMCIELFNVCMMDVSVFMCIVDGYMSCLWRKLMDVGVLGVLESVYGVGYCF